MKKVILLLIMLNFAGSYTFSQQQVSEKEKKVSYSFINEYGLNAGGFRYKALSFTLGFSMKTFNDANYFGGAEVKVGYTF